MFIASTMRARTAAEIPFGLLWSHASCSGVTKIAVRTVADFFAGVGFAELMGILPGFETGTSNRFQTSAQLTDLTIFKA